MRKAIHFIGIFTLTSFGFSFAQDCSGNRYYQEIFTNTTTISDVQYGSNLLQDEMTPQDLLLNIYLPTGDTDTDRPLVIFAHGGSFISGNKEQMAARCNTLARMGYVSASISYRLLSMDSIVMANPGLEFQKEVIRAVHDMKAAIRFFRRSVAENGNPYGINPDIIIVGGSSAGAILANHVTYMDDVSKVPADVISYVANQGGLEGNSGNSGYSSIPQMAVSLCGAIGDTTWIEPGDQPFVGVHNVTDNIVPSLAGYPTVSTYSIPVMVYGDSLMHLRGVNVDISSAYMNINTTGHCSFPATHGKFVTDFMHEQLCVQGLLMAQNPASVLFSVYPNPAERSFFVDIPSNEWNWNLSVVNVLGQTVFKREIDAAEQIVSINALDFNPGLYLVRLQSDNGREATKRVVIN